MPVIALEGGSEDAKSAGAEPALRADPAASQSMTLAARIALVRVDNLVGENASDLRDNRCQPEDIFGSACAKLRPHRWHSDGCRKDDRRRSVSATEDDLRSCSADHIPVCERDLIRAARGRGTDRGRLGSTPSASLVTPQGDRPGFADAQWSDSIPKLVQARLVQAFENFSLQRAVDPPGAGDLSRPATACGHQKLSGVGGERPHRGGRVDR